VTTRRLPALLAVLVVSGCAGDDESAPETVTVTTTSTVTVTETTADTTTETTVPPPGDWTGLEEPLPADGNLPVDEFNAYAESVDEPWERVVAATTNEYVGRDRVDVPSVSFQATSGGEGAGPTNASLLLSGLLDDSVRARRYDLTLSRRQDGTWRIDSASWAQSCQQGRGHQAFTPEPCL
jgi:hypothetical protein